jgi:hypothetical protein
VFPSPAPPPMPPALCPMLEKISPNMLSIRDQFPPKWCSDYDWSREKCELSYIRAGNTYNRCFMTQDDGCEMSSLGWQSCLDEPPAPPSPPSMPSSCAQAVHMGFTNDLRKVPVTHRLSGTTHDKWLAGDAFPTTGYVMPGINEAATCEFYAWDKYVALLRDKGVDRASYCKHSFETDGVNWYPCLWSNVSKGGEWVQTCLSSPTERSC